MRVVSDRVVQRQCDVGMGDGGVARLGHRQKGIEIDIGAVAVAAQEVQGDDAVPRFAFV